MNTKVKTTVNLFAVALLLICAGNALVGVHYADVNSANATPPCISWATAATNIQDAVDAAVAGDWADPAPAKASIPWSQLCAKAGADYQGDGLAVIPAAEGARLRCVCQRLEGEATPEGLWLTSNVTNGVNDRFRIVAADVRRLTSTRTLKPETQNEVQSLLTSSATGQRTLPGSGTVALDGQKVCFARPGLVEEYGVSVDGVRQDFVVLERPSGVGELAVLLAVSGAKVESADGGARLVLDNSGRMIAYGRLRVTDASGKELAARMEIPSVGDEATSLKSNSESRKQKAEMSPSLLTSAPTEASLTVLVNDANAVYPVRIDPTFSDANWISMGGIPGANYTVYAAVVDDAGKLYIGGSFTVVGDVIANHVATWNGTNWSALGSGMNGNVSALAISGSNVYAAGSFTTAGGIAATNVAKWDGSSWSALGSGTDNSVRALAVSGSDVYAGGAFTMAGGTAATNIAKWDGSNWSALGLGMDGWVSALAVSGGDLYAGGYFTTAGGVAANAIAKWDGSSWTALGSGMGNGSYLGAVSALAVSGSDVYAGGNFTTAGGIAATNIAKWNGSGWSTLGLGLNPVYALAVSGGAVYAVNNPPGGMSPPGYVRKWDGNNWSILGQMNGNLSGGTLLPVYALAVSGSQVYAAGYFTTVNGISASDIARWNGSGWSALGSGMNAVFPYPNPSVQAVAVAGSDLYVGGRFTTQGGIAGNSIAKWNGSGWSALGSGLGMFQAYVGALAVSGDDLYVGGNFTTAGGIAANAIAKWNGSGWSALGSGLGMFQAYVGALAVSGSDLYVGGNFTTAGGIPATNIAQWNGNSWTNLGSGINGSVNALAVMGSTLYVGGSFTSAGDNPATNIAKWDGNNWSALGSGLNGYHVSALAVSGGLLYAGGYFTTTADGNPATNIAKWDGNSWSALGLGVGNSYPGVQALAVLGSDLYAGGSFTRAGGNPATNIAKWNGSDWSNLGSGINGQVQALAVTGGDLYAGGVFTTAGGKVSAYVARTIAYPPVLAIEGDGAGGYFIRFSGVPGSAYWLQRASGLSGPWTAIGPQTAPASGLIEFHDTSLLPSQGFYRAVEP